MSQSFFLTNIGQLAAWDQHGFQVIAGAAIWVADGKIQWVGKSQYLPSAKRLEQVDAEGKLVTAGLVDAHTHCVFGGDRLSEFEWRCEGQTYQEIARKGGGIRSTVRATRSCSPQQLLKVAIGNYQAALQLGTTSLEVKSGYDLSTTGEISLLKAAEAGWASLELPAENLSLTYLGAHAVAPEFEGDAKAYVTHMIEDALPKLPSSVQSVDAFVEEGYFRQEVVEPYLRAAIAQGKKVRLHVDQLRDSGGAAFAARVGATSADHLEHTSEEGVRALAAASVFPVLLPGSVLGLGLSKYPDARAMLGAGLKVVLATDFNPGSSPVRSLPSVMNLACRLMRMTPAEALTACTVNAAASLGWGDRLGRIAPGYQADFVVWDAEDYRELAYWTPPPAATQVYVKGSERLRSLKLL